MSRAYDAIAERLLAMTDDAGKWQPCWHRTAASVRPINYVTRRPYRGANVLSLWCAADFADYPRAEWASFRQWLDKGQCVKKGEKGTPIVYWGEHTKDTETEDGPVSYRFVRGSHVFNIAQVAPLEGQPDLDPPAEELPPNPDAAIAGAELFAANTHARVEEGRVGGSPCFIPSIDVIRMPPFATFHSATGYYGVLLHELTHWTGHKTRLDRLKRTCFGSGDYALEELVAELGSAFLCADLGIENEPRPDHAQYLANWHAVLKKDVPAFMAAVGEASKAADYLHQLQQQDAEAA